MIEAQENRKKGQEIGEIFDETKKKLTMMIDDNGKDKEQRENDKKSKKELQKFMKEIKKQIEEQPTDKEKQFEWQLKHFDAMDKWDLDRDIIVLVHDTSTGGYYRSDRTRNRNEKKYNRKSVTKEFFDSLNEVNTKTRLKIPEHVLKLEVDNFKDVKKMTYTRAKAMLDEKRMLMRYEKNRKKNSQEETKIDGEG